MEKSTGLGTVTAFVPVKASAAPLLKLVMGPVPKAEGLLKLRMPMKRFAPVDVKPRREPFHRHSQL
jgi:hypothetical protein